MSTLYLLTRSHSREECRPRDVDLLWLRKTAGNADLHITSRGPSLLELARRKDLIVLQVCESLLTSVCIEQWFLAVDALGLMATNEAVERLLGVYREVDEARRRIILTTIAKVLSEEMAPRFKKVIRDLIFSEVIDVTHWTSPALAVLRAECYRLGVRVVQTAPGREVRIQPRRDITLYDEEVRKSTPSVSGRSF